MNNKSFRLIALIGIIFSLLFLPVWLTVILCLIFSIAFSNPFEAVAAGYILDVLYGIPSQSLFAGHVFLISFLTVFLLSFWIREHLAVGL